MNNFLICTAGASPALPFAAEALSQRGLRMTHRPGPDVTHLLLPVPSFEPDGRIRGGGILEHILADLPGNVTIFGGKLSHQALAGYPVVDLLLDGAYTAANAAITADCAIRVASPRLKVVWEHCPVLIIGWGRIGKCLARQLKQMGASVTVAARKDSDRHILTALGFRAEIPSQLRHQLAAYRIIFNTAPAPVLSQEQLTHCRKDCIKIELASTPGIAGSDVISALGLPGKMAPESSGQLIAQTILRKIAQKEAM